MPCCGGCFHNKIDGSTTIIASPAGVVWTGNGYLISTARNASDGLHRYIPQLDRMEQIKILEEKRDDDVISAAYELSERFQKIYDEGEDDDWEVKLKVDNTHAFAIAEKFGHEAEITPLDEKHFIATLRTWPSPELYIWAVSFNPRIEIIYPPDAEDEMRGYFSDLASGEYLPPPFP